MIYQRPGFERRFARLTDPQQAKVRAAINRFEASVGRPHLHSGIGLRPFGRFLEFRAGLELRILALPEGSDFFLVSVGNHDTIRAWIKSNR